MKLKMKDLIKENPRFKGDSPYPQGRDPRYDVNPEMGHRTAMHPPAPDFMQQMHDEMMGDDDLEEAEQYPSGDPEYPDVRREACDYDDEMDESIELDEEAEFEETAQYPSGKGKFPDKYELNEKTKFPAQGEQFPGKAHKKKGSIKEMFAHLLRK